MFVSLPTWIMTFLQLLLSGFQARSPSRQVVHRSGSHSLRALLQAHALVVHLLLHLQTISY